jgi:hypothetical protein
MIDAEQARSPSLGCNAWNEAPMTLRRREFLQFAAVAAAAPAVSRAAFAENYPVRPVKIVAGFATGGGVDISARLIGQWLTDHLGQSFVTENLPGAGGNVGTEVVVTARPTVIRCCSPPCRTRSTPRCTRNSVSISSATSLPSPASSACR